MSPGCGSAQDSGSFFLALFPSRVTPLIVFPRRDRFKMGGVYTFDIEAEMIDMIALGNRTLSLFVIITVGDNLFRARPWKPHLGPSPRIEFPIPNPASLCVDRIRDSAILARCSLRVIEKKFPIFAFLISVVIIGDFDLIRWEPASASAKLDLE